MKFIADCMLGTLAKWLIVLGHDVRYERRIDDSDGKISLDRKRNRP